MYEIHNDKDMVIIGSEGRLGKSLCNFFCDKLNIIPLSRNDIQLDSKSSIINVLSPIKYDYLILASALTSVDYCEKNIDDAYQINRDAPDIIANISIRKKAHMTYLSTDMVFNGENLSSYKESDVTCPLNVYGSSKLAGEECVLNASDRNLVLRISWLFGPYKSSFPDWILGRALNNEEIGLPCNKIANPTYTEDLVYWINCLLNHDSDNHASGIYHLCNKNACSWQEWGEFCLKEAKKNGYSISSDKIVGNSLHDVKAFVARRPLNSSLDTNKFEAFSGITPRHWQEPTTEFIIRKSIENNKSNLF
jgi:dTDP-4-dehydrorhamnose reductase